MFISKTLTFYKRPEIQKALVEHAEGKEIAVKFGDKGFGSRPQVLMYPNDVLDFAKKRCTSFHGSEELWQNPSLIRTDMKRSEQDELRKGWDFILDLDCTLFEYSKIAAHYVVKALEYCGVESVTVKFSGNKGFHIAVPWEAFPNKMKGEEVSELFPEAPRRMAEYIKFLIKHPVKEMIKKREGTDIRKISEKVGIPVEKIKINTEKGVDLNPEPFIEMDTLLISSRHLYRMPYSFHEKSQLVSVPIDKDKILDFEKSMAEPENVTTDIPFCDRDVKEGNAEGLLVRAYDFKPDIEKDEGEKKERTYEMPEDAIGEECFPPSIKRILAGLADGRKRAVFILINFFRMCGWNKDQIESELYKWNEKNKEPLREGYIQGQLKYSMNRKPVPPPNYDHQGYYADMGIDVSAEKKFKNPVNYAKVCAEKKGKKKGKKSKSSGKKG